MHKPQVYYKVVPLGSLGQQPARPQLPKSLVVPAIIGVGLSIATMAAITYGMAYALNKEEERYRS